MRIQENQIGFILKNYNISSFQKEQAKFAFYSQKFRIKSGYIWLLFLNTNFKGKINNTMSNFKSLGRGVALDTEIQLLVVLFKF